MKRSTKITCSTASFRRRISAITSLQKACPSCSRRADMPFTSMRAHFLPHIPPAQFPGVALAAELYLEGGIRSVEIGTLMFGKRDENGVEHPGPMDLLRLAIPRRVYTQSHIDYVVEVILEVWRRRARSNSRPRTHLPGAVPPPFHRAFPQALT